MTEDICNRIFVSTMTCKTCHFKSTYDCNRWTRVHHWCLWGLEIPNPRVQRSCWKRGLPSFPLEPRFPLERWIRGSAFSCRHWKTVFNSFSHMPSRKRCPLLSFLSRNFQNKWRNNNNNNNKKKQQQQQKNKKKKKKKKKKKTKKKKKKHTHKKKKKKKKNNNNKKNNK